MSRVVGILRLVMIRSRNDEFTGSGHFIILSCSARNVSGGKSDIEPSSRSRLGPHRRTTIQNHQPPDP